MVKKKRRIDFSNDESTSDSDDAAGFHNYIKKKSVKVQNQAAIADNNNIEFVLQEPDISKDLKNVRQESKSAYISRFLKSKEQRDFDKLHIETVKNQLKNELQKTSCDNDDEFVTEGYQKKKGDYELASKLAEKDLKDDMSSRESDKTLGNTAQSVAFGLLLNDNDGEIDSKKVLSVDSGVLKPLNLQTKHENDIYRTDNYEKIIKSQRATLLMGCRESLDPIMKEKLVRQFLQSNKTPEELHQIFEEYSQRHRKV